MHLFYKEKDQLRNDEGGMLQDHIAIKKDKRTLLH